jgi:hypothetical protein
LRIHGRKAVTSIELTIAIGLMVILTITVVSVYQWHLRAWNEGYARSVIRSRLLQALESVEKPLLHAQSIDALSEGSITFTADLGDGGIAYRLYLFNENDPEPNPPYSQESYTLRLAKNDMDYGEGVLLSSDIARPAQPVFLLDDKVITIQLSALKQDERITMSTKIRPRNM